MNLVFRRCAELFLVCLEGKLDNKVTFMCPGVGRSDKEIPTKSLTLFYKQGNHGGANVI